MINKTSIWNHGIEAMQAFAPYYQREAAGKMRRAQVRVAWLPLLRTAAANDEPLAAGRFAALTPYLAGHRRQKMFDEALDRGLLAAERPGLYNLTSLGQEAVNAFFINARAAIAAAPTLPPGEMEELAAMLRRLVEAAQNIALPRSKANLESSRSTDPGEAPPAVQVDQYLTDLMHFRNDAHNASWQAYNVDGRSWEAFTCIWRDHANTPADLARKLAQRGYDEEDYARATRLLLDKGWIELAAGRWQVTGNGRALRDVAEMVTDRLFFTAWQSLSAAELQRLNELLVKLSNRLRECAPLSELAN